MGGVSFSWVISLISKTNFSWGFFFVFVLWFDQQKTKYKTNKQWSCGLWVWVCVVVQKALLSIFLNCQSKRMPQTNRFFLFLVFIIRIGKFLWIVTVVIVELVDVELIICSRFFCFKFYFNNILNSILVESKHGRNTWHILTLYHLVFCCFSSFVLNLLVWLHFVSKWLQMKSPKYTSNNLKISTLLLFWL